MIGFLSLIAAGGFIYVLLIRETRGFFIVFLIKYL